MGPLEFNWYKMIGQVAAGTCQDTGPAAWDLMRQRVTVGGKKPRLPSLRLERQRQGSFYATGGAGWPRINEEARDSVPRASSNNDIGSFPSESVCVGSWEGTYWVKLPPQTSTEPSRVCWGEDSPIIDGNQRQNRKMGRVNENKSGGQAGAFLKWEESDYRLLSLFRDLLPAAHQYAHKENRKEQHKIKSTVIACSTCPGVGADRSLLSVLCKFFLK